MTREEVTNFWTDVVGVVLSAFDGVSDELADRIDEAKGKPTEEQKEVFCEVVDAVVEKIVSRISDEALAKM